MTTFLVAFQCYVMTTLATYSRSLTFVKRTPKLRFEPVSFVFFAFFLWKQYVETVESPMFSFHDLVDDSNAINFSFYSQFFACVKQPYIL